MVSSSVSTGERDAAAYGFTGPEYLQRTRSFGTEINADTSLSAEEYYTNTAARSMMVRSQVVGWFG